MVDGVVVKYRAPSTPVRDWGEHRRDHGRFSEEEEDRARRRSWLEDDFWRASTSWSEDDGDQARMGWSEDDGWKKREASPDRGVRATPQVGEAGGSRWAGVLRQR